MPRSECQVCTHPDHDAINAALVNGERLNVVAEQFSISKFSLSRHRAKHLNSPKIENGEDSPRKWLERAEIVWEAASHDQDVRGQCDSVRIALRALEATRKHEEQQETKPDGDERSAPVTVAFIDSLVEQYLKENPEHERAHAVQNRCLKDRIYLEQCEALAKEKN